MISNVAIAGKAGSGKTTIARQLVSIAPHKLVSLATPLKVKVFEAFEITKSDPGARDVYLAVGTALRNRDRRYWIDLALEEVQRANTLGRPVVIDDLRTDDEYEVLRAAGFVMVRLDCPTNVRYTRIERRGDDPGVVWSDHETETALDSVTLHDFDLTINTTEDGCACDAAREILLELASYNDAPTAA